MCELNSRASKYIKPSLIEQKGEIQRSTMIVKNFNTTCYANDRTTTKKMSMDIDRSNTINQQHKQPTEHIENTPPNNSRIFDGGGVYEHIEQLPKLNF